MRASSVKTQITNILVDIKGMETEGSDGGWRSSGNNRGCFEEDSGCSDLLGRGDHGGIGGAVRLRCLDQRKMRRLAKFTVGIDGVGSSVGMEVDPDGKRRVQNQQDKCEVAVTSHRKRVIIGAMATACQL